MLEGASPSPPSHQPLLRAVHAAARRPPTPRPLWPQGELFCLKSTDGMGEYWNLSDGEAVSMHLLRPPSPLGPLPPGTGARLLTALVRAHF